ncbi:MAG: hypothetical protein QOD90_3022, partial [Mycobacterium sp.]|nr:hypothetical protein [Mycobacterium sp.]
LDNACTRMIDRLVAALNREAWSEVEQLCAPDIDVESRRKFITFTRDDLFSGDWLQDIRRLSREAGDINYRHGVVAVRGERLALIRLQLGTADVSHGAPQSEMLQLVGLDSSSHMGLAVWFDVDDMDAAIAELDAAHARFEARHPRAPIENVASRVDAKFNALFTDRRFDEIGALFTESLRVEDRRRGLHRIGTDRATELAELRAVADLGIETIASDVIAIRGDFLALVLFRVQTPQAFTAEFLRLVEVDSSERVVTGIFFDPDDIDAAFAELEARYLAGEAAAHAHTWSVIAGTYAEFNRHDGDPSSAVNVDNRRVARFAPGDLTAANTKDLMPNLRVYVERVHRLGDRGAVVTFQSSATSQGGFEAEWRTVHVQTVAGDLMDRNEMFDEADLDTAIARFDELSRPTLQLENAASRAIERFLVFFAAADWDAIADTFTADYSYDDRRRVVNAGTRQGPTAAVEDLQSAAAVGITDATSTVIATRGAYLALTRSHWSVADQRPEPFRMDVLQVTEVDADERVVASVAFDPDDLDAAFAELEMRYLAGEAAANSDAWSVVACSFASFNRHEVPSADWPTIDRRRATPFEPSDMTPSIRSIWDLTPDLSIHIETVHRLSNSGAVITHNGRGSSREGFDAEWRAIDLLMVEGDRINRCEIFDEADLDAALARFDELTHRAPRLENAACRAGDRYLEQFAAHDWNAMAEMLADDFSSNDRRRVVGAGVRLGRDAEIASMRAVSNVGLTNARQTCFAERGGRLSLSRIRFSGRNHGPEAVIIDGLVVVELNADNRIAASVVFDLDDVDAAFEELDARYLAGEAADYAHIWSVIAAAYASFNRRELPATTRDWVNVDHRRAVAFAPGEMSAFTRAAWDLTSHLDSYIETVHRLSNLGAVVTHASLGASQEVFAAEWREIGLFTVEGDLISRFEVFDEADIGVALARFDELTHSVPRLENAASRVYERFLTYFAARDWAATAEILADDISTDDRRRVVNAGLRRGRAAAIAEVLAIAEVGIANVASTVIATRGRRLALSRERFSVRDQGPEGFDAEVLGIVEIDADERIVARVSFDLDDIDAAFEELDARYLAGEGAAHAHTWSLIAQSFTALNRHEMPATTTDYVIVDHTLQNEASGLAGSLHASWELTPELRMYVEAVHRLSDE